MYHSRFFFYQLAKAFQPLLSGARLLEAFSQQKDELMLVFLLPDNCVFHVRADLSQGCSILSFPEDSGRSRSNTVNLFPEIAGAMVEALEPEKNDRLFRIRFENGFWLCFKMYGQRSNLLLHDGEKVLSVFNNHLKKDLEKIPQAAGMVDDELCWHPDPEALRRRCPGFTKRMWQYWEGLARSVPAADQSGAFASMITALQHGTDFFICRDKDEVFVSFFPMAEVLEESDDPLEISNRYYRLFWQVNQFEKEKSRALESLQQQVIYLHQQIQMLELKGQKQSAAHDYRQQADLLMAYGQDLPKGLGKISLPAFDGSGEIEIKLKKDLSIPANAERFYRKARGQQDDLVRVESSLKGFRQKSAELQATLQLIRDSHSLKALRKLWPESTGVPAAGDLQQQPFHQYSFMQYEIRVGKNAKANDELLRLSHKDDWWLHARDVPGSHVLVRVKKGNPTPAPVLQRAAELAAYYSKAGKEGLVPVMLTERKYVRKIKGAAPGQVKVEREKTLLVVPTM
jgi:predicted ribosome quality control (RQC) complex YloA/Tae2 family protein